MPFIGKQPKVGAYQLIDSITTSATATYALTISGDAFYPESARNLIVSLNGITQAPESAYTVSGSNIVFDSALTSSDVIDYILVIGDAVDIGTPSDGTVGTAQMNYPLGNFSSTGIDDNADSTAITIDSSERVGIGTASPSDKLHVYGGSSGGTTAHSYTQLHIEHNSHAAIQLSSPASTESVIFFSDPDDNDIGGVGYYHAQDYLYLRSVGATRLRVDADGIKFGSDSAAANALDDYEEGTWTPFIKGYSQADNNMTQTYSEQTGTYTKIGNTVTAKYRMTLSNKGNISGNYMLMGGFPFNFASNATGAHGVVTVGNNLDVNVSSIWWEGGGGFTHRMWLLYYTNIGASSVSYVTASHIKNNTVLQGWIILHA